jgi:hypothetical protein
MVLIKGQTAGAAAAPLLSSQTGSGVIVAIYRRSLLWRTDSDLPLTLSLDPIQRGPLVLEASAPLAILERSSIGDPVTRSGDQLCFGTGFGVDLRSVRPWAGRIPHLNRDAVTYLAGRIEGAVGEQPDLGGIAPLILGRTSLWTDRAAPAVALLRQGLASDSPRLIGEGAQGLIGLGPGLTPSGDDLLGGWLAALMALGESRSFDQLAKAIAINVQRTSWVSGAHLKWAARGYFGQAICALLEAAAALSNLDPPLRALLAVGASSGADMAAGIWTGIHSTLHARKLPLASVGG